MTFPVRLILVATLLVAAGPETAGAAVTPRGAPQGMQQAAPRPGRTPVTLVSQPGTPLDQAARRLVAQDLAKAGRSGEQPLLLVGAAAAGGPGEPEMVFVQLQSPRECGSAGCSTSAYLRGRKVLDGVSGPIILDTQRHKGVRDLVVGEGERYAWTGTQYANVRPAPAVNLRPRHPRH